MVAQSVMSVSDMLGHWDIYVDGFSATDPRLRQWISVCTMPKGCWHVIHHIASIGNCPPPHTCLCVRITEHLLAFSNDGVA